MRHRSVADELIGPQHGESGDGIAERDEAGFGQAGRQAQHVLFGHADVEEAVRKGGGKGFHHHEAEIRGQQHHSPVTPGQFH